MVEITINYLRLIMNIGLFYDTAESHKLKRDSLYFDFSSLEEVKYVSCKLQALGHNVILISDLKEFIKNIDFYKECLDLIFNMYEGIKSRNRESFVPAICEAYEIPYTGSDSFGTALTLNKFFLKLYASSLKINVPYGLRITQIQQIETWNIFPCVIKPEHEGSSMGVYLIYDKNQLKNSIDKLLREYCQPILIEEYINGPEVSICIIEENGNPEVVSIKQFSTLNGNNIPIFDRETKKLNNHESFSPTALKNEINKITELSKIIFKNLPLSDVARIDWRISESGEPYLLEITPLPDWQPDAEFDNKNRDLSVILNKILTNALERFNRENR